MAKKKEEEVGAKPAESTVSEIPAEEKLEEKQVESLVVKPAEVPAEVPRFVEDSVLDRWVPKTKLGRDVFEGKIKSIDEVFMSGRKIIEPEIVDKLLPGIKNELVLVGGRAGKGGGVQRIPVRITAAMHKSGRRFHMGALVIVGNEDGIIGVAQGRAPETRDAMRKATEKAKLSIIQIKRGCGSWECGCGTEHSVPYKISGKSGSVRVELIPAPRGVGLVAENEAKKILKLAGVRDVWVKTFGNTGMRINLINALFDALKKIYIYERGGD